MTKFVDGPAAGVVLSLRRAPKYLRVVRESVAGKFAWDALDQLDDTPRRCETLFAYRRVGEVGTVHIDGRTKGGRRFGEWYKMAEYRACSEQPDDATMRSTEAWRAWCWEQQAKE